MRIIIHFEFFSLKLSPPAPCLPIPQGRGKILGGSSSINGMIFQRGNPLDYERWASAPGMQSWDYSHCLPYFKRLETCVAAADGDEWRGKAGHFTSTSCTDFEFCFQVKLAR